MKVPLYEDTVEPNQVAVPTPEFSKPPVDAFGGNVAQAEEKQGQAVSAIGEELSNHIIESAKMATEEKARSLGVKINEFYRDRMYADGTTNVKDPVTGVVSQIPSGYMRQTFHQADNAANNLRTMDKAVMDAQLEQYKDNPLLYHMAQQYHDVAFEHAYDKVIAHVAEQQDLSRKVTAMNLLKTQVNQFGDAKDVNDALRQLDAPGGVQAAANTVEQLTGIDQTPKIAQAIQNYAIGKIDQTGDTTVALGDLGAFSKKLSTTDMQIITNAVQSHGMSIKKHFEFDQAERGTKQAMNVLANITAGKGIPSEEAIAQMEIPTEWKTSLSEGVRDYHDKERQGTPENTGWFGLGKKLPADLGWAVGAKPAVPGAYDQGVDANQLNVGKGSIEFTNMAANIMKIPDQQTMISKVFPLLRDTKLNTDERTALVELAIQRSKGLPTISHEIGLDGAPNPTEGKIPLEQQGRDAVMNQLMGMKDQLGDDYPDMFRSLNQAITDFKITPQDAFETLVADHHLRKYPKVFARGSEKGVDMTDRFGKATYTVYSDGRVKRKK